MRLDVGALGRNFEGAERHSQPASINFLDTKGQIQTGRAEVHNAVRQVYGKGDMVLAKLKDFRDLGVLDPNEYPGYVAALKRLKPECWQDIRMVSHSKIPFINAYYEGSFGLNVVAIHKKTNVLEFVHEIGHHVWNTMMNKEQRSMVKQVFKSLTKEEKIETQYKKHGLSSFSVKEWFCQSFTTWFHKNEPGYTNIATNPKLTPVLEIFKSLVLENRQNKSGSNVSKPTYH